MKIELLWFSGCPSHEAAEVMLRQVLAKHGAADPIVRVAVEDEEAGNRVLFPGSPTIRINGDDVEPGWEPCADCTPRCRLYLTSAGLRGIPEWAWVEHAVIAA